MKTFVIIFRQSTRVLSPDELAERQRRVSVWAETQNAAGYRLEPRILAPEAWHRSPDGTVGDVSGWPVTALLFLVAADLNDAAKVAASHPALAFGAAVDVRRWAPPNAPTPPR